MMTAGMTGGFTAGDLSPPLAASPTRLRPGPQPSPVRRPPGSARDAAHAEWFHGFRLAVKTDLGSRIVRAWSIVPAAVSERDVAEDLLEAGPAPRDLLADKGSTAAPSPHRKPPAAPPSSSRPARTSAPPCPPSC